MKLLTWTIIATALLAIVCEGILRYGVFQAPRLPNFFQSENASALGYTLKPGKYEYWHKGRLVQVEINAKHHRVASTIQDTNHTPVIVIGDSQVFGWGLNDNETIPHQLQQQLNPMRYRVENWGLPGSGPDRMIRLANTLPENAIPIFVFTEVNDGQDSYTAKAGVQVHCNFLISRWGIGQVIPCSIMHSHLFGVVMDIRDWWAPQRLAPPLNCNPFAKSAAAVIRSRVNISYDKLKQISNAIILSIPWDAKIDVHRLSQYKPQLKEVDCDWDFPDTMDLLNYNNAEQLFQDEDHHLSAQGAAYVAKKLAIIIASNEESGTSR